MLTRRQSKSKKMHVLQLGPFPPPHGGVQTNILAIRDELLRNGYECSIIAITRSEKIINEKNVYHPRGARELLRLLFILKYDVLHLHIGGNLPLRVLGLILTCAQIARGKCVMTFHSGGYAVEAVKTANLWTREGFLFRQLTKIIVVNELMVEMFQKFGVNTKNIKLIRPFALSKPDESVEIPSRFQKFMNDHKKILLAVSGLEADYDLPLQINGLGLIRQEIPDVGLVIVGAGSLEKELRALISTKPYAKHILLAGDTNHEVVLHLIEKCDILLRTTIFDGDAISIREAIYLGTPVIATDNGMRPEGVNLIPTRSSIKTFVEKVVDVLSKKVERKSVEKDSGRENIAAVLNIYKELAQKQNAWKTQKT
jgi:glycosyltransferase involved in cell wall biosynthesis